MAIEIKEDGSMVLGRSVELTLAPPAVNEIRAALAQPDAAADARATLEQAVRDGVISGFSEHAETNEHETWHTVYLKRRGDDGVSRSYWTSERSLGSNVRAMQCAAAQALRLRKPVLPEVEGMTLGERCDELTKYGARAGMGEDGSAYRSCWILANNTCFTQTGRNWDATTTAALKEARKCQAEDEHSR